MKKFKKHKLLSLIIPTYRQEKTIVSNILYIQQVVKELVSDYEIIVVVDGTEVDNTFHNLQKIKSNKIIVTGYATNRGKGNAVRFGMAKSKGDIISFMDADLDINPKGISMLLEHFEWHNADIVVGSKLHPVSKVHYPFSRVLLSWGYRTLVKILFGLSIRDTQVGLKLFRRKVLVDVLPRLFVKTYAFDIEILVVAYRMGYKRIYEAPIELDFSGASSIVSKGFWKTILHMLWDTLVVYYRLQILHYYDTQNKDKWVKDPELTLQASV